MKRVTTSNFPFGALRRRSSLMVEGRTRLPLLVLSVCTLLVMDTAQAKATPCPGPDSKRYTIKSTDTCAYLLTTYFASSNDTFAQFTGSAGCADPLQAGATICLPKGKSIQVICPRGFKRYPLKSNDTCTYLLTTYFGNSGPAFAETTGYSCTEPLNVGSVICVPRAEGVGSSGQTAPPAIMSSCPRFTVAYATKADETCTTLATRFFFANADLFRKYNSDRPCEELVAGAGAGSNGTVICVPSTVAQSTTIRPIGAQWSALSDLMKVWDSMSAYGWRSNAPCASMLGVTCNRAGVVIRLWLPYLTLGSYIPPTIAALTGLTSLNLAQNWFQDSLPNSISRLAGLQELYLNDNLLTGPLPLGMAALAQLKTLDVSDNNLWGTVDVLGKLRISSLDLSDNQFAGALPRPGAAIYRVSNNYFSFGLLRLMADCTLPRTITGNCLAVTLDYPCTGPDSTQQRPLEVCHAFCGTSPSDLPCGGHGECYLNGPNLIPTCSCDTGYALGQRRTTCVPLGIAIGIAVDSSDPFLTPILLANATFKTGVLSLTSGPDSFGAAYMPQPICLFSITPPTSVPAGTPVNPASSPEPVCGTELSFNVTFSFRIESVGVNQNATGMAFVISPATAVGAGGSGLGYFSLAGSVAVEMDAKQDAGNAGDGPAPHVAISVNGGTTTLASAKPTTLLLVIPRTLLDRRLWVDYDADQHKMWVYLAVDDGSDKPSLALLSGVDVNLCELLAPSASQSSYYFGFTGSAGKVPMRHTVTSWSIDTVPPVQQTQVAIPDMPLGLDPLKEVTSYGSNRLFQYASAGYARSPDGSDSWSLLSLSSWLTPSFIAPVLNQNGCEACWAFAAVASIESAHAILHSGASAAPQLSVTQMLQATGSSTCTPSSPALGLQYAINMTNAGCGLSLASSSPPSVCENTPYKVESYAKVSFQGWFGLLLAVQRQPAIVHIQADADSFRLYDGTYVYQDPSCYSFNLNHVVVIVGYLIAGVESKAPGLAPPYWIIRNSWGPDWGSGGYMRMAIQGGNGVCGVNTLPALVPVVKDPTNPCNPSSFRVSGGPALNPCGGFTCSVDPANATTNVCDCKLPFVMATNTDGSRTCAYLDACGTANRNPCLVGTCVNDGKGAYSCVCPPGYWHGLTDEGSESCFPGDAGTTYIVTFSNVRCSDIHPIYSLTLTEFKAKNPTVNCNADIPVGTEVDVSSAVTVSACTVLYYTSSKDTCASLQTYFNLTDITALNRGLDCTVPLKPNTALCVERNPALAGFRYECSQWRSVTASDTCDSLRLSAKPPLSPLSFFRLNMGINCDHMAPAVSILGESSWSTSSSGYFGFQVCLSSQAAFGQQCPSGTKGISTSMQCAGINSNYYYNIQGAFKSCNGFECPSSVPPGMWICDPAGTWTPCLNVP
ncbi:unnamed protein product [Closterium sp. NIES-64]|nr:unnamed protein product [Closterium sp. NIES-64]